MNGQRNEVHQWKVQYYKRVCVWGGVSDKDVKMWQGGESPRCVCSVRSPRII